MARIRQLWSLALALPVLFATTAASAREHAELAVERVTFPVTLSDQNTYEIVAYHYHEGPSRGRPLQVVVHGATYDHRYWDAGVIDGVDYSYARHMAERGFDVLAVDELGAGESSRPDGDFLTLSETADGLAQVLSSLRTDGNPTGHAFRRIGLVGHSYGSVTSIYEESQNHLADALVITGWDHIYAPRPFDVGALIALLTTPYLPSTFFDEPTRAFLFYYQPTSDPAVISYDASTLATTFSRGQMLDLIDVTAAPLSDGVGDVTGPVLVQLGGDDVLVPEMDGALETTFWTSASSVTVQNLPDIGHDLNLHLNHQQSWAGIERWLHGALGDLD